MSDFPPLNEQMDAIRHGALEIIPEDLLARKVERSIKSREPLLVKQGFDPTRPDLHLGHLVSIRKLRTFQDLGHRVVFLIGDFTAMVGDPSGASETRPRLTEEEVSANAKTYREQVFRVLDPKRTVLDRNSRWHAAMSFPKVLELASHYTVARLLERDDFQKRYKSGSPISVSEFLYALLQGYDSVELKADVELGGSDQKFNLLVGRTLMERYGLEPQVVLIMPLLRGLDGSRKMSKSYDNYIGITVRPESVYGKTMSIPVTLLDEWSTLLTALKADPGAPYQAKRALAAELVTQLHDAAAAVAAAAHFDQLFKKKEVPDERPSFTHAGGKLAKVLKDIGFAKSLSEARRMIEQGGVQIDGEKVSDVEYEVKQDCVVKYGKLKFADLKLSK